jgi:hypothetical protein
MSYEKLVVKKKRVNQKKVKRVLKACFVEQSPPSLSEVCRRVRHSDGTLYAHFAELSYAIGQRYQTVQKKEWIQRVCDEVREAVYRLCAQGHYPSEWAVKKTIATRGAFKLKVVREVWRGTLREKGLMM